MTNPVVRWAFYVFAFSVPIEYPTPLPMQIHTATAALLLVTALVLEPSLFRRPSAAVYWIGAYVWIYTVLMLLSAHVPETLKLLLVTVIITLVLWVSSNVLQELRAAKGALVSVVLGCITLAVAQLVGVGLTVVDAGDTARQTVFGQDANFIGGNMALGLIALVALSSSAKHAALAAPAAIGAAALLGNSLLVAASRGAFAAIAVGLLAYAAAAATPRAALRHLIIAVLVASALLWTGARTESVRTRVERSFISGNMAGREHIYPEAWRMFLEKPVLGWGPVDARYELRLRTAGWEVEKARPSQLERDAHNLILEALMGLGLAGTIPFLVGIALCVFAAWQARAGPHGAAPFALVSTLVVLSLSANWSMSKEAGLLLGYGLAARRSVH